MVVGLYDYDGGFKSYLSVSFSTVFKGLFKKKEYANVGGKKALLSNMKNISIHVDGSDACSVSSIDRGLDSISWKFFFKKRLSPETMICIFGEYVDGGIERLPCVPGAAISKGRAQYDKQANCFVVLSEGYEVMET